MGDGRPGSFHLGRFLRNAAIIVAVIGGGAWLWFGVLKERFVAKRFASVTEIVHRSGQMSQYVVGGVLEQHGIRHIVDLTEPEYMPPGKIKEREVAVAKGIDVLNLPLVGDGTGDVERYARAVAALIDCEERKEPVLVHCAAGTHRTGGVVACFRILYQGWTREAALAEAQQFDWKPDQVAMSTYLDTHLPRIRELLVEWGKIPATPASPAAGPTAVPADPR